MTEDERRNIDLDLINSIKDIKEGDPDNCVLYMRGDNASKNAVMTIKGDSVLLANTFIHHVENNPLFKQFVLAVIGSWLSKNPVEKKMFIEGIDLLAKQNGMYVVKGAR